VPWHAERSDSCPADRPWAVINDQSDERESCHVSEDMAQAAVRARYANEGQSSEPRRKAFDEIEVKADDGSAGEVVALASVFDNVDLVGDKMLPGAFTKTLEAWREKGKPIPIVVSHNWDDPMAVIGGADPNDVEQTDKGLEVRGKLHLTTNGVAAQVHRLMREKLWTDWSFGYTIPEGGEKFADGVNEISEVELVEVGPTLKGANPEAQLQAVKSLAVADEPIAFERGADMTNPEGSTATEGDDVGEAAAKATWAPWDGSPARFSDEQYARSCILDRAKCGDADMPAKQRYSLPIREPGGALNSNAVHAAAARINQVSACDAAKQSAKAALRRAYGELNEDAPDSIKSYEPRDEGLAAARSRQPDPAQDETDRWLLRIRSGDPDEQEDG
jgi:Escherichia/Staphylococcus phage prohead protease